MFVLTVLAGCGAGETPQPTAATSAPQAATENARASAAQSPAPAQSEAPTPGAQPTQAAAPAASTAAAPAPTSGKFQLGTHYQRLSPTQPTSSSPDQVEVAEIFWYGCPHCFALDPFIQSWQKSKPEYVSFVRVPAVWNPTVKLHARAFYTADALGKGAEMHDALFSEIHNKGNLLDTEAKLQDFFGKFNVSATEFKSAFDSFAVHTKLQRADELNRRYRVPSVPMIVVNGKYVTDVSMAGGQQELLELIDELAAAERAGK
jgi:thiol:disulfide interchange protein DsbA